MFGISFPELLVIALVGLVLFGPDKLPELARTLGQLSAQLRKASDSLKRDFYRELYPPLSENPLTQAQRELRAVSDDLKSTFTGTEYRERWTTCESNKGSESNKVSTSEAVLPGANAISGPIPESSLNIEPTLETKLSESKL